MSSHRNDQTTQLIQSYDVDKNQTALEFCKNEQIFQFY